MRHIISVFLLLLILTPITFSSLPLIENPKIKTVYFVQNTKTKLLKDGEVFTVHTPEGNPSAGGEQSFQKYVWIDFENKKVYQKSTGTLNAVEQIGVEFFCMDNISTFIMHDRRMVMIDAKDFRTMTEAYRVLGWFHEGVDVHKHITTLSRIQFKLHDDETRSFWLRKPKVEYSAEFFLNPQNQIIRIHNYDNDPKPGEENTIQSVIQQEWKKMPGWDFEYPVKVDASFRGRDMEHIEKIETVVIQINAPIPDDLFAVNYPDDYQVQDMRDRKGRGGYGGFGGYGGGAQR